jgi:ADP-ribose pyrophosphatase YjhB (NUDIX family)
MDLKGKFCPHCGHATETKIPDGDNRLRRICTSCLTIHYDNPRVVAGSVVFADDKILLCKRAIEPRYGYWTLPAGFLEADEDVEAGAQREAYEEACAQIRITHLLGVYSLPYLSQIHVMYLADLVSDFKPGVESLDVRLYRYEDIPWHDLAFTTVRWALAYARKVRGQPIFMAERKTKHTWDQED